MLCCILGLSKWEELFGYEPEVSHTLCCLFRLSKWTSYLAKGESWDAHCAVYSACLSGRCYLAKGES